MDKKIDPAMAQRVWQRVQSAEGPSRPEVGMLVLLLSQALADAEDCQRLARISGGKGGPLLELARQDRSQAGTLRGVCRLLTGKVPQPAVPRRDPAPREVILQRCYANHLRRLREYSRYQEDPDLGPVFQKLAAEERTHCTTLLELFGSR